MAESRKQSYLGGAAILTATVAIVKIIGFLYKIPLYNLLGDEGTTHFQVTYTIYSLLLTISTAGIPVALSRLVSSARAVGRTNQVQKLFSMGMATFVPVGIVGMLAMLIFAPQFASLMGDPEVTAGIRALAPAVLFVCIVSVYRGYAQGFSYMVPTAISQVVENLCKLVIGLIIAFILVKSEKNSAAVSAGAIVGVTVGLGAAIPIMIYYKRRLDHRLRRSRRTSYDSADSNLDTVSQILRIGIPITLAASVMNIISLIDTKLVLMRLQSGAGFDYTTAKILYGAYSKGLTLFNLPSAFVTPITVAVVPAIAGAIARGNRKETRRVMESSFKVTALISFPMGVGMSVLASPIYQVLYPNSNENGPFILALLGISTCFVCTYLITNAMLQANGYEKLSLVTLPVGGIIKVIINWILVGNPSIGIKGAPIGTLVCYVFITAVNVYFIRTRIKARPRLLRICILPVFCTLVMAAAAWGGYGLIYKVGFNILGAGRLASAVYLVLAIGISVIIYGIMVIVTGTINSRDMELIPKGETIGRILHVKQLPSRKIPEKAPEDTERH